MLIQTKTKSLQIERHRFKGNEPLLLDDPNTVWIVQSGSLALFAIALKNSMPDGKRRYLFKVGAKEAMFPTPPSSQGEQRQILAVSLEETELLKLSREDFGEFMVKANGKAVALVERWIERLGSGLADLPAPSFSIPHEGLQFFSLAGGEIFQPDSNGVSWTRIQQGRAFWMGLEELPLEPASGMLPLGSQMWLQAEDRVELESLHTSEIQNVNVLINSIAQLQIYFLRYIDLLEQQEMHQELVRFEERERLNRQVMHETLAALSSVLQPKGSEPAPTRTDSQPEDLLLSAAGAVGRSLGITIRPPAKSEDLKRVPDPLEAIARASRIRMRQIQLTDGWWKKDSGPILAYTVEDTRPVALLPISDGKYEIFDPKTRKRSPVNARSADRLAPSAYIFYRPLPEKALKTWELLQFALRGRLKELAVVLLTGIAATLLGMLTPQATAILIDNAIPDANRGLLLQIALGLSATAFGATIFQLAQGLALLRLETFADSTTQAAVWDRLLKLKASFFRQYSIGDLDSRVQAISQIRQLLSGTVLKTIFTSLFALLNLGLLIYYNGVLAAIAIVAAMANIAVTIVSGMLTLRKVRPLLELQGEIFGVMVQLINGVAKLRVAGAEARAFGYWGKQYSQQVKLLLSTQGIEDILTVINKVLPTITSCALFWFATNMLRQDGGQGLTTGTFLAFNAAFGTFIGGATSLSSTVVDVLQIVPLWKRSQPILQAEPEVDSAKADPGKLSGRVVVDHIVFRYRDDGPLTLDDVSVRAEPGEFIALVGTSGSGKSTLFRLLLGFDVPESGSIYYDGQDLAGLEVHAVRRQLGVVLQNSRLMSASIFENIASGARVTMEEAWEAARMAGFAEDVESMPMGMHTVVSEGGTNLSGGQRQRLLIARALVLKPRILLFDEATSALDNKTQAIVSESLDRLQVTRIVIAHRLSTIRNANRIYVFQNGRVVQQGSFEQLSKREGLFAQLMARQTL
ncbi:NHLM bacteriocin system ABC transporter, ATP-binding protein [Pleurocapsa sp. PCC 7327]|uniref:NHLP bacteriocin export ABC transporter permease/ATPase subunit n=1 Tax=Pleurocapsa sp. PCC 7327 TaxID=118163 RepID=UPI00029F95D2|nr:NHLP bacteriocin export ABC transporter permease/ATPase subunit [Pleurocapsa sp. PCC 7327]AFY78660.1 NHLM bacteriocin system ABC transporter, ATP-binding protein [Pleurocapsa sp. PCC 7327]